MTDRINSIAKKHIRAKKSSDSVPGPTIRGTYSTYESMKQRDLNGAIGNVVDLHLEDKCMVEIGGWGTTLKIVLKPGVKHEVSVRGGITTLHLINKK